MSEVLKSKSSSYTVVSVVGEGSYGKVYECVDESGKLFCVKTVLPHRHPLFALRTYRELKTLMFLRNKHHNIANLMDVIV